MDESFTAAPYQPAESKRLIIEADKVKRSSPYLHGVVAISATASGSQLHDGDVVLGRPADGGWVGVVESVSGVLCRSTSQVLLSRGVAIAALFAFF